MAYVHWVTIQLSRDVDAELANIRTTSRRDITNPPVTFNTIHCFNEPSTRVYSHVANVLYERGPAIYTQQTQDVDSMVDGGPTLNQH